MRDVVSWTKERRRHARTHANRPDAALEADLPHGDCGPPSADVPSAVLDSLVLFRDSPRGWSIRVTRREGVTCARPTGSVLAKGELQSSFQPSRGWLFDVVLSAFGLFLVVIFGAVARFRHTLGYRSSPYGNRVALWYCLGFAVIWTIVTSFSTGRGRCSLVFRNRPSVPRGGRRFVIRSAIRAEPRRVVGQRFDVARPIRPQ